jgi:peptidoglycan/LPS O-acetylase OafA/YrhL
MRISAPIVVVALALVLILPVPRSMSTGYDLFCILLVLSAIVYASMYADHGALYERLLQSLGNASDDIYILQFPVVLGCRWFWRVILHHDLNRSRPFLGLTIFPLLLLLTVAANRWIDEPARRWLRLKLHA